MQAKGFSLIELVLVIVIVGIFAVMMMPSLKKPTTMRPKEFVVRLNTLMQAAWQQALLTHRVQKIVFNFVNNKIKVFTVVSSDQQPEKLASVTGASLLTELDVPSSYRFENFYIERKDEMRLGERTDAYFYLVPEGLAQEVIINGTDRGDQEVTRTIERFSFVLNPFSAQFEYYGLFQAP